MSATLLEWIPAIVGVVMFVGAVIVARHAEGRYRAADARLIESLTQERWNAIVEVMKEANNG